ncbi:MAG: undecaprenyl/decaprenyl-phosphate alpha-N-acetylglucosaminyl 1-phosphate transferase [Gammaproteobacteria bacterium]|nr:undecaprenyl/decaprenyl-phosphate alpha-N-acetylglucosaminyl 1-phosphate transferase [Gammaproteobacteria bacterium]
MAFVVFLSAALLSLILVPPLIRMAYRFEFIDAPDARKVHVAPIPRIGGLAMVVGTVVPLLVWLSLDMQVLAYLLGAGVIALFGIWDDRADLNYRIKFAGQFIAAAIPVFLGGVVIRTIPFGPAEGLPDLVAYPLTLLFVVGITNAVNLSDGLDGLAGGVALLSLIAISLLAYLGGGQELMVMALAVSGAIFGFLRYNTHPASIFMGDTGSQFLGFSLGVLTIMLVQSVNTALSPVLLILILGLPILDTASVMYQRLREGRSPFSPDKNHLHHKFLSSGLHHYEAVSAIYLSQGLFIGAALLLRYESDSLLLAIYGVICFAVMMLIWMVKRVRMAPGGPVEHRSTLANMVTIVRYHPWFVEGPMWLLAFAVPVFLVVGSLAVPRVPGDFGILALVFATLLLIRLLLGFRVWFIFLRLIVFVTIAFVVYLLEISPLLQGDGVRRFSLAFFAVLGVALVLSIRYRMGDRFRATPSDFLLILGMLSMGMIPAEIREAYHLIPVVVKLVILFYCAELILKAMKSRWSPLPLAALGALGILAVRGLI